MIRDPAPSLRDSVLRLLHHTAACTGSASTASTLHPPPSTKASTSLRLSRANLCSSGRVDFPLGSGPSHPKHKKRTVQDGCWESPWNQNSRQQQAEAPCGARDEPERSLKPGIEHFPGSPAPNKSWITHHGDDLGTGSLRPFDALVTAILPEWCLQETSGRRDHEIHD